MDKCTCIYVCICICAHINLYQMNRKLNFQFFFWVPDAPPRVSETASTSRPFSIFFRASGINTQKSAL